MKVGDKVIANKRSAWVEGTELTCIKVDKEDGSYLLSNGLDTLWQRPNQYSLVEPQKDKHYNNENGSLYLFAHHHNLNAWEFDCIKRLTRCRKKGQFKEDLEKTKRVIDLYLKEFEA